MRLPTSLGLVLLLALGSFARPARADDDVARLREELEAQKKRQAELEARVSAQEKALEEQKAREARDVQRIASPERDRTKVGGFAHLDWVAFRQSSENEVNPAGEPLNQDRFVLRRAKLRVEHDYGYVHGAIMLDANTVHGAQVRPYNVEGSVKWPADTVVPSPTAPPDLIRNGPFVIATTGLLATPFGYEVQELALFRPWLERSTMSEALFPESFDLGLRVMGGAAHVNWALGIMNGAPLGDKTFPGRDPNKSKDLVFRIGTATKLTERVRVAAGFSGLTGRGFHEGTQATKDHLVWRDQNEDTIVQLPELQVVPGSPATPSESFSRFAMGADARVEVDFPVLGTLQVRGEIVRAKNLDRGLVVADPVAAGRDFREVGWYVGATQELTKWAMVGVRYDLYDPDSDAQDQQPFAVVPKDASFKTWSFMAAGRLPGRARLLAQYDRRKNALGRDAAGAPTTLADDSFTMRLEVRY